METWETTESTDIILKVRQAQIRQLYKQTWVVLTGVLVITLSICIALWQVIPQWKLLLWAGIFILLSVARGFLTTAFQRKAPVGADIYWWAKLHVIGTSASGLMWALASLFLWPGNSPVHQLLLPICIVALSAAAVASYCTWKPTYISFLVLSAVPISLRLLLEGGLVYVILGLLGLFLTAYLIQTGKEMHNATLRAFVEGFHNEALSTVLSAEKAEMEELNRKLQMAHDQIRKLSMTDELTGLWNRRFLNANISEDVAQVIRNYHNVHKGLERLIPTNIDIVFLMMDLDHFKVVNDTYGHGAGDQVLIQIRQLLTGVSRDTDTIIRWGGEEFLVVARNARGSDYMVLAERIRLSVENHQFDIGLEKPLHLTCSIGVAVFPFLSDSPEALSWDRVVELADACQYTAKRSGRNAWVGITLTGLATLEDITPNLAQNLPGLIKEGKLEMKTSLPANVVICWTD